MDLSKLKTEAIDGGVLFTVKVVPGSSRTKVSGVLGGMLKVKVSAAPEKGKANKELTEFLCKQLGSKKGSIRILSGHTSAVKQVEVVGVSVEQMSEKL